jgi:choline kinase
MILAAGVGRRLHPLTETLPKPLLNVGARTLLERQLDSLLAAGVTARDITLVGGHGYQHLLSRLPKGAKAVYNPNYEAWNNIYSITLGELGTGSTLVVNGDGLYHPQIFAMALERAHEDFLVLDTRKDLGDEEMKAAYVDGALMTLSKELSPDEAAGEYIGIARFTEATFRRVRQVAGDMVSWGDTDCWYESAIERVARERRIGMLDIGELPWTEIDDKNDLDAAATLASRNGGFGN